MGLLSSEASELELSKLDELAKNATVRHRTADGSSFGFKTREVQKQLQVRRRELVDKHVATVITSNEALAVVSEPQIHGTSCVQAIDLLGDTAAATSLDALAEYQRAFAKAFRARLRDGDQLATSWMREKTPISVSKLLSVCPLFNRISDVMCEIPDRDVTVLSLTANLDTMTKVCNNVASASRFNNLYSCMKTDWVSKCQAILFDDCDKLEDVNVPKLKKPLCSDVPYCLCDDAGDLNFQMRVRLHAAIKGNFNRSLAEC